jgi:hypothetical protein
VLPWKNHIYIDYTVSCEWPPSSSDHPGSSPVTVFGVTSPGLGPWVYSGSGFIHYSISIEGEFVCFIAFIFSFVTQICQSIFCFLKCVHFRHYFYYSSVSIILWLRVISFSFSVTSNIES